jgi:hypothetical protein
MVKICKIILLFLVFSVLPGLALAADLSITPSNATFESGELITLRVVASSNESLNAISGSVQFPISNFTIESVSKSDSILSFWVTEPSLSKATGIVSFEGVALSGYTGSSGNVITIRVKAINTGQSNVLFKSGQIFANDGQGTNITGKLSGAVLNVVEPKLKPVVPPVTQVTTPIKVIDIEEVVPVPPPLSKPALEAPEIVYATKYGNPAINGKSKYPEKLVVISLVSDTGNKVYVNEMTDSKGDFIVVVPSSLKQGMYSASAVVVVDGVNSLQSREISIKIGNVFSDVSFPIYALVALMLIVIIYQFFKIHHSTRKYLSSKVKKELFETEDIIHKSFDILRDDLKIKKTATLKSDMNDAEDLLSKKIKKIESL